ncbi:ABC transporter ATP-binding protein [Granulicoccus phenolivorans]|uniref:ABC transporter ATP-binding protein n=1 Tax=Granulicoccus phenolivorans TaxID=266854 RepID=UPI000403CAC6|nr:ABC transporter ATP-binding protein [Granulicoccus phenolivorans]
MTETSIPARAAPAIRTHDLARHFGAVPAVDGIDLQIDRGEIVALLGPNGAGKTTLLDLVLGFTAPSAGTVSVLGRQPRRAVAAGAVGAVLQTDGLLHDLTVRETVAMIAACQRHHLPVAEVLERAGISAIAGRKVNKCSGGEQQRLRFALALLTEPDLMLLDEPTAGMDVRARTEFWAAMHAEAERGRTIVFATHYLQEAADFADRIVLLGAGRVLVDGTVAEVTARGRRTLSCDWLAAEAPARFADRTGLADPPQIEDGRVRFTTQRTDALARTILTEELGRNLEVTAASLDEVFLDLTSEPTGPRTTEPAGV